jgi:CheY-like chemotaxis protein/signal transduction histidine kinase
MSVERVLVVDDDDAILNLMVLAIRRKGYQVEQASDGFQALEIIAAQPPFSVILSDLMMPGMTGIELLREAKKLDEHVEVVIITAVPDLESAISSLRADGAYDYLLKPFDSISQLILAVERAAAHRRLLLERDILQAQMQQEAETLRALITNTGDAILSANSAGILKIVNPAAARLMDKECAPGQSVTDCLPPHLVALLSNWQAVGGNLPAIIEVAWPNKSIQMVSLTPIQENAGLLSGENQPDGDQTGWVAVLRDITHIKHMEDLKMQLLTEASGKIRIPLAQAMNSLVELNILTSQNEQVSGVVYHLTQTWKRIQEWADDLSAMIRIDSQTAIQSTSIDLKPVFQEMDQSQGKLLMHSAGVRFEQDIDPGLPMVIADPGLLRRLLLGLVSRAVSRSEAGCVVRLQAHYHNHQVWIGVSDDGPAISDGDLPHFFQKSFVKTGGSPGSTGLEMALVKSIIDRMGGQIWVGGKGNKGGTIFVCLPVDETTSPVA